MKNIGEWKPTKFVKTSHGFRASRDPARVNAGSRFIADILAQRYTRALGQHARGQLLDLGCGHVPLYDAYRHTVEEVFCVDWANTNHKNPHLDLEADLNKPIPLDGNRFDTVLLTDVLEHIAEPGLLVNEIARLLRPAGKLIAATPFLYWLHEQPNDYYRYTEFALRRLCAQSSLRVLELTPYGGLPEVLADLFAKSRSFATGPLRLLLSAAARAAAAGVSLKPLQQFSTATAPVFPLGYVWVAQK